MAADKRRRIQNGDRARSRRRKIALFCDRRLSVDQSRLGSRLLSCLCRVSRSFDEFPARRLDGAPRARRDPSPYGLFAYFLFTAAPANPIQFATFEAAIVAVVARSDRDKYQQQQQQQQQQRSSAARYILSLCLIYCVVRSSLLPGRACFPVLSRVCGDVVWPRYLKAVMASSTSVLRSATSFVSVEVASSARRRVCDRFNARLRGIAVCMAGGSQVKDDLRWVNEQQATRA